MYFWKLQGCFERAVWYFDAEKHGISDMGIDNLLKNP
jgi:hypothetical protein